MNLAGSFGAGTAHSSADRQGGKQFPALANPIARQERHLGLPLVHPDRRPLRFDLAGAIRHFNAVRTDKERTSEVFHIFECLPWARVDRAACAFLASERGQAIYASEPYLPDILDDHENLRRLPKGSLAQAYCDYMEAEGLSATGLVAEYETYRGGRPRLDDKIEWYTDRLRDTHDLLHILTGFGRDALGEQCVMTFVCTQRASPGHLFVGYAGALVVRLHSSWKVPVLQAVREAHMLGKACPRLFELPIRELLATPIEDARAMLNIRPARHYPEAQRIWREEGIDPNAVIAGRRAPSA